MNDFDLSMQEGRVMAGNSSIPMLVVGEQRDLWFRGNNLTAFLEYAQPRVALTKILKSRNTKTFAELLPQVVSNMETTPVDDPRARYVNEPGLYRLIAKSTMEKAEHFQDWRLRSLSQQDLIKEFAELKLNLRQGFVSTGMGDLQSKLLTIDDAKKRKAEHVYQARKQQKLLQAEQPKAIQCAA
ncbi:MAG: hypothetical protein FRX49_11652 [Trebouxia sp. A1-2]|nr:MAG: hypothetical protein FRX49_11652 [Trebouxia sp. A1-2]